MSLIDLVYKIMPKLNKNHSQQEKLQEGVIAVQNVYDESDTKKEANKNAMNMVIETIQGHPEMPVGDFLKMIQENTDLSDSSLVEIIKQIPIVKSEEATVDAVEKVDLVSEAITEIIQEAPVSPVTAQKIAEQIPDEDIQKEQQEEIEKWLEEEQRKKELEKEQEDLSRLTKIYDTCDEVEDDTTLALNIKALSINTRTEKIDEKLASIVAKRVALDCMAFGSAKIPSLLPIMPATDLLEADLPLLAEKEYQKIKIKYDEQGKDYHTYGTKEKKLVKEKLLESIARKVAETFNEIGDISVPQIEQLKNLSEEESNVFIKTVKQFSEENLEQDDIARIQKQLKGETVEEWENLKRMLEKMKPKDREIAVRDFSQVLKVNESKTQKQKQLDEAIADIGTYIRKLPNEKKLSTAKTIVNVLKQQQEAINMWKEHKQSAETENKTDTEIKKKGEETSVGESR